MLRQRGMGDRPTGTRRRLAEFFHQDRRSSTEVADKIIFFHVKLIPFSVKQEQHPILSQTSTLLCVCHNNKYNQTKLSTDVYVDL